jgi:hypothetical protein
MGLFVGDRKSLSIREVLGVAMEDVVEMSICVQYVM